MSHRRLQGLICAAHHANLLNYEEWTKTGSLQEATGGDTLLELSESQASALSTFDSQACDLAFENLKKSYQVLHDHFAVRKAKGPQIEDQALHQMLS